MIKSELKSNYEKKQVKVNSFLNKENNTRMRAHNIYYDGDTMATSVTFTVHLTRVG